MVPFKSLGTVSCSPSIVTMAVSVAVCETFSVKEWYELENRVSVCSRSLEMAPFDRSLRSHTTMLCRLKVGSPVIMPQRVEFSCRNSKNREPKGSDSLKMLVAVKHMLV